jgi:hypothetical protein
MVPQKIHEVHAAVYPTRAEKIMMLTIMALLVLQLAWTIRASNYQPPCIPATLEKNEPAKP